MIGGVGWAKGPYDYYTHARYWRREHTEADSIASVMATGTVNRRCERDPTALTAA